LGKKGGRQRWWAAPLRLFRIAILWSIGLSPLHLYYKKLIVASSMRSYSMWVVVVKERWDYCSLI
jgi:hypothetical protein